MGWFCSAPATAQEIPRIETGSDSWNNTNEMLEVEATIRQSILNSDVRRLKENLLLAELRGGVDRELMTNGRRRLAVMQATEVLRHAVTSNDVSELEDALEASRKLGVDAASMEEARARLSTCSAQQALQTAVLNGDLPALESAVARAKLVPDVSETLLGHARQRLSEVRYSHGSAVPSLPSAATSEAASSS